jgi:hypothetical protein
VKNEKDTEVVLSAHVIGRMAYRGITEENIIDVLTRPDRTEKANHGYTAYIKKIGKRRLQVIAKKRGKKYYVLTAFPE